MWNGIQTAGMHCTLGDVHVSEMHPKQVVPQPCVTEIANMDYIFLIFTQTKEYIKRKYGVDVQDAAEDRPEIRNADDTAFNSDVVSQIVAYYRNEKGGIGMFSWVQDYILADMDDYQERKLERCKKCGSVKTADVCPECGSTKFEEVSEDYEELMRDIPLSDGSYISKFAGEEEIPVLDENGMETYDELGNTVMEKRQIAEKIPYYKPNVFPLVLRKNISKNKQFWADLM